LGVYAGTLVDLSHIGENSSLSAHFLITGNARTFGTGAMFRRPQATTAAGSGVYGYLAIVEGRALLAHSPVLQGAGDLSLLALTLKKTKKKRFFYFNSRSPDDNLLRRRLTILVLIIAFSCEKVTGSVNREFSRR
jgi:hypothetical protein